MSMELALRSNEEKRYAGLLPEIEDLKRELYARNKQLNDAEKRILELEQELREERMKSTQLERGVSALRAILMPLHNALRMVFGEIDGLRIGEVSQQAAPQSPAKSVVWESWKEKLGGMASQAIDALLLHGEMTSEQLAIHIGTKRKQTVYDTVHRLNKANLINKRDGKISLKEL